MAVGSTGQKITHSGDGIETQFTFPYPFQVEEDLHVIIILVADGTETEWDLNLDYTVSPINERDYADGGYITTVPTLTSSYNILIERIVALTQNTDYQENDTFRAETHETALDKLTYMIQQLKDQLERSPHGPTSDDGLDMELPPIAGRKSKLAAFDVDGALIPYAGDFPPDVVVSPFGETLVDDLTAAAARTTLGAADDTLVIHTTGAETKAGNLTLSNDLILTGDGDFNGDLDVAGTFTIGGSPPPSLPAGTIIDFGGTSAPTGYLACDGTAVSRSTYADLFTAIGETWGAGDGTTTFNVPDLRGAFTRGTGSHGTSNMANGNDFAGPSVGSFENDQLQGHRHAVAPIDQGGATDNAIAYTTNDSTPQAAPIVILDPTADGTNGTPRTGDETRPFAGGVLKCIKT